MQTIHIAIDGGDVSPQDPVHSGISRIVRSFITTLPHDAMIHVDYYFFSSQKVPLPNTHIVSYHQLPSRGFFSFFLPLSLHRRKTDIFLGFSQAIPRMPNKTKAISFIYDLSFMDFPHHYAHAAALTVQAKHAITHAHSIITCSEYVRAQIIQKFPSLPTHRIAVIPPGIDHIHPVPKPISLGFPYFISVGVVKPMKNIMRMIQLFSQWKTQTSLPHQLILIGSQEHQYMKFIESDPLYKSIKSSVIWKESVSDKELTSYYQQSSGFLLTSYAEGYCFPLFEALHIGIPAIAISIPLLSEYTQQYPRLTIAHNDNEFLAALTGFSIPSVPQPIPILRTWKRFTQGIVSKIKEA